METGHTKESMADAMGLNTSAVNRIECGKRQIKIAKATKKSQEDILGELYGVTVNSSIKENHGNGVNVENSDLKTIKELYERIITEKEKYISHLETALEYRKIQ